MEAHGAVFVVTGAGNGIGREVTLDLLARGASVAGLDINKEWLSETSELAGANAANLTTFAVDITNRKAVMALPAKVTKALGEVDGLINVAGIIQPFVRIAELDFEHIDRVVNVNLHGPLNLIKAFLPGLLTRPSAHLANVSSMGSYAPVPGQTLYGATKAGINLLSEGLRSELRATNVAVTVIYPGAIGTNIAGNSGLDMSGAEEGAAERTVVAAKDAGRMIVEGVLAKKKRVVIGQDAKFLWHLNHLSPDLASNTIYKNMKDLLP